MVHYGDVCELQRSLRTLNGAWICEILIEVQEAFCSSWVIDLQPQQHAVWCSAGAAVTYSSRFLLWAVRLLGREALQSSCVAVSGVAQQAGFPCCGCVAACNIETWSGDCLEKVSHSRPCSVHSAAAVLCFECSSSCSKHLIRFCSCVGALINTRGYYTALYINIV